MSRRPVMFELLESKDGPRCRILFANGRILATTEAYSSIGELRDSVRSFLLSVVDGKFEVGEELVGRGDAVALGHQEINRDENNDEEDRDEEMD